MIKILFKTAWRNIIKGFRYNSLNMFCLAGGLSSFIIILLFMNYEFSYDKWDPQLKRVYKIYSRLNTTVYPSTPAPLANFLVQNYPNAEAATTLRLSGNVEYLISANGKKIYEKNIVTTDSSFFKVFPYQLCVFETFLKFMFKITPVS